ncbi:hypothetical protein J6590_029179 [Homalodisca vitripennis]|nr:hypothetical protein J6590_029179 [Homalodisca vitripennis]
MDHERKRALSPTLTIQNNILSLLKQHKRPHRARCNFISFLNQKMPSCSESSLNHSVDKESPRTRRSGRRGYKCYGSWRPRRGGQGDGWGWSDLMGTSHGWRQMVRAEYDTRVELIFISSCPRLGSSNLAWRLYYIGLAPVT